MSWDFHSRRAVWRSGTTNSHIFTISSRALTKPSVLRLSRFCIDLSSIEYFHYISVPSAHSFTLSPIPWTYSKSNFDLSILDHFPSVFCYHTLIVFLWDVWYRFRRLNHTIAEIMSTQVGMKPAPAGQTVNFVDPPTQTAANIAMYTVMLVACTLCLAVRMYTRKTINRSFGFDDGKPPISHTRKLWNFANSCPWSTAFAIAGFVSSTPSTVVKQ